jgi:hypothetical protein
MLQFCYEGQNLLIRTTYDSGEYAHPYLSEAIMPSTMKHLKDAGIQMAFLRIEDTSVLTTILSQLNDSKIPICAYSETTREYHSNLASDRTEKGVYKIVKPPNDHW